MGTEVDSVNEFEDIICLDPRLSIKKSGDMGAKGATKLAPLPALAR
jgi:hypothetical protein